MGVGIPAKYEFVGNSCISHLLKFFLVPRKIMDTITNPVVHTESAPQPITDGCSPSNRPIEASIIITIVPIGPIISIIAIALRAVSDSGKLNILLPTMDEERTIPVIPVPIPLLSASFFFPTIIFLLAPVPIFSLLPSFLRPSVSYYNPRSGRPS